MSPKRHRQHAQKGQSSVELLVAGALLLVPLFILVPLLGKYIDLQSSVLEASRYAAFQRTAWSQSGRRNGWTAGQRSDSDIATRAILRYFSITGQPLASTGARLSAYKPRGLWSDQAGHALLPKYGDITVSLGQAATPDPASRGLKTAMAVLGALEQGGLTLDYNGLFTASVQANPIPIAYPPPFNSLALHFQSHDTLLSNGWAAVEPAHVVQQVQATLPRGQSLLATTLKPFALPFPDLNSLDLGKVNSNTPQELPSDRIHP